MTDIAPILLHTLLEKELNMVSMDRIFYVYIMTNSHNTVLYTGITNNLIRRVYEHKNKQIKGFTAKYNINKLVYFEEAINVESAISREKQIKAGSRKKKEQLIHCMNPGWVDLYGEIIA